MSTHWVTLDEAKDQVAIEPENDTHNGRLMRLIESSQLAASQFLNAPLEDFVDSPQSPPRLNEDIKTAILFIIEADFARDDRMMQKLLQRAENMLWPYRQGLGV